MDRPNSCQGIVESTEDALTVARRRIADLEESLFESEQERAAAAEIIQAQDGNIEELKAELERVNLLLDLEAATRRQLERRLAELEVANVDELADPCQTVAPAVAVVEKRPIWFDQFKRLVEKCWTRHGPSKSIQLTRALVVEKGLWLFRAAPVFQEIYGGKDDGMTVWTGFEFHTYKLMRAMTVIGISAKSCCTDCNPTPTITIRGAYRGHMLKLTVLLEPAPGSPVVELIDTLKGEIRDVTEGSAQ